MVAYAATLCQLMADEYRLWDAEKYRGRDEGIQRGNQKQQPSKTGRFRLSKNPYFCSKVAHLAPTVLAVLAEKRCGARFCGLCPHPAGN